MTQRVNLQPAFILHRRPYRETSQLLEVFTREHGRLGLVGRGTRRSTARRPAPVLEPLQEMLMSWTLRGDLGRLGQAEPAGASQTLTGEALFSALYLNELLLRLIARHDPHPGLFDQYRDTLAGLCLTEPEPRLRLFEKRLLQEVGYGLNLTHTIDGDAVDPDRQYDYQVGIGARAVEKSHQKSHGLFVSGASLLALECGELSSVENLRDAKLLLRAALAAQLGDKPLNTPVLFRSLRRMETARSAAALIGETP